MPKTKYKIQTNPVAISRAWTALGLVDSANLNIPQVDIDEKKVEELAYMLILNLANVKEAYNMFLNAITGEKNIDFYKDKDSAEEVVDLVVNFCKSINSMYLSFLKKHLEELKKQRDSVIQSRNEMIQKKMEEIANNPELLKQFMPS